MRFSLSFIFGLLALVAADATLHNREDNQDVIANHYIVVYKPDADLSQRGKHESDINLKAKGRNKKGIHQVYDVPSVGVKRSTSLFAGYAVEIDDSDLPAIISSPLVSHCLPKVNCSPTDGYILGRLLLLKEML
jgi:hypothetical protein